MRQIVLDTETTGLSWEKGNRIVEVGCIELLERRPTGRSFQRYFNPGREMEPGAQEVTGLSLDFLQDKPRFETVVDELLEFIAGAELIINGTTPAKMENALKEYKDAGLKATGYLFDVTNDTDAKTYVDKIEKEVGPIDILVNNAARQQTFASILDIPSEEFDATMKTNIYAPFWTIKAALPHMQPGSVIIGTSSVQAYDPSKICTITHKRKPLRRVTSSHWRNSWPRKAFG